MIFGLDAAAMNFINKNIDRLDSFKHLMSKGAYGTMKPLYHKGGEVYMWDSMNIWTSLYTGLIPEDHTLGGKPMRVWNHYTRISKMWCILCDY